MAVECGNFSHVLVDFAGYADLKDMLVVGATISDIDRDTCLASILLDSYDSETYPDVISEDVPFFYHCEYSTGTEEDLEQGHWAFFENDSVIVIHIKEREASPAQTYIVAHKNYKYPQPCDSDYLLFSIYDDYENACAAWVLVDPRTGDKIDVTEEDLDKFYKNTMQNRKPSHSFGYDPEDTSDYPWELHKTVMKVGSSDTDVYSVQHGDLGSSTCDSLQSCSTNYQVIHCSASFDNTKALNSKWSYVYEYSYAYFEDISSTELTIPVDENDEYKRTSARYFNNRYVGYSYSFPIYYDSKTIQVWSGSSHHFYYTYYGDEIIQGQHSGDYIKLLKVKYIDPSFGYIKNGSTYTVDDVFTVSFNMDVFSYNKDWRQRTELGNWNDITFDKTQGHTNLIKKEYDPEEISSGCTDTHITEWKHDSEDIYYAYRNICLTKVESPIFGNVCELSLKRQYQYINITTSDIISGSPSRFGEAIYTDDYSGNPVFANEMCSLSSDRFYSFCCVVTAKNTLTITTPDPSDPFYDSLHPYAALQYGSGGGLIPPIQSALDSGDAVIDFSDVTIDFFGFGYSKLDSIGVDPQDASIAQIKASLIRNTIIENNMKLAIKDMVGEFLTEYIPSSYPTALTNAINYLRVTDNYDLVVYPYSYCQVSIKMIPVKYFPNGLT